MLTEIMSAPDKGIPQDLLGKAECLVVVPGVKKAAFIVGAKYGKGFMLCRRAGGGWSAPAAIRVEGGSVGFQIGGSETDVLLLVMNQGGAKKLMQSKFTVGADANAALGPVGRDSSAETDAQMHAEILTYSRSRGLFAGVSLQGATLRPDEDWNKEIVRQTNFEPRDRYGRHSYSGFGYSADQRSQQIFEPEGIKARRQVSRRQAAGVASEAAAGGGSLRASSFCKHAADWRRRIGAADGEPQDVVQFIVVVQIFLAEIQPGGTGGGGRVAGLRSSSEIRGFSA